MPRIRVIALDLEGTLVHSVMSPYPRPGLLEFLERCRGMVERLVLFTAAPESTVRGALARMALDGHVPPWFATIEFVQWNRVGAKDLAMIGAGSVSDVLLVDDNAAFVRRSQRAQWIPISTYDHWRQKYDAELLRVGELLAERCAAH